MSQVIFDALKAEFDSCSFSTLINNRQHTHDLIRNFRVDPNSHNIVTFFADLHPRNRLDRRASNPSNSFTKIIACDLSEFGDARPQDVAKDFVNLFHQSRWMVGELFESDPPPLWYGPVKKEAA